jgi:aldehyde dehydrogenase (NAD+)
VQEGIAETLHAKLRVRMEKLRLGPPLDKAVDMGAVVAPVQLERIASLVAQGRAEGATVWQPSRPLPAHGSYYPPTLCTDVFPSSTIAQVEIFGPVLVSMTFRTPDEAVTLANNTPFGLAASVWTENINLALDIAPKIKAGVVWVNATNLFDAATGFGGYRESGFGREGGREGMWEYLRKGHGTGKASKPVPSSAIRHLPSAISPTSSGGVNRTAKLFIAGKQARPDGGYSRVITSPKGRFVGEVGDGNRKDIRNAVEAAHAAAKGWASSTGHLRAQILYYIGENLDARRAEFATRIAAMTGGTAAAGKREVDAAVRRLFTYAAWADKWDGAVHSVPIRGIALAMHEPIGVVGVVAPDGAPLLGLLSLVAPLIATGNTVVALPSEVHPLAATDLYQVFETSDLPGGVVNIVTGGRDALAKVLAEHEDVDAVWYCGSAAGVKAVELASAANMKRTWCTSAEPDWFDASLGEGRPFLREAVQVKNIWIPYGE